MKLPLKTLLADVDNNSLSELSELIKSQCTDVYIVDKTKTIDETIHAIIKHSPDLLIIDTNLKGGTVFDIFKQDKSWAQKTIITSKESKYAQKAFDYQPIHYILKPVKLVDLNLAIQRFIASKEKTNNFQKNILSVQLPTDYGLDYYIVNDIIKCENIDQKPILFLSDGRIVGIDSDYDYVEKILRKHGFVKINDLSIVNLTYVKTFSAGKITLANLSTLQLSENQKENFIYELNRLVID